MDKTLKQVVDEGGTLDNPEALAFAKEALRAIINPEASLLATVYLAVNGSTTLVPHPKNIKARQSVYASLLNVRNQIQKMIEVIEELEHAVHEKGNPDTGVGESRDSAGRSPLLDSADHGDRVPS